MKSFIYRNCRRLISLDKKCYNKKKSDVGETMRMRWRWPWLILGQAFTVSVLTALAVFALTAGADAAGVAYGMMMWAIVPIAGALTAFITVRMGLVSFASFWLPPILITSVHWLIAGYPPLSVGMPLTAALTAIVGAAAGEEVNRRGKKRARRGKK